MNHQAIIEQLSFLAPQLKAAEAPESVLVKYASDRNLSPAQLERIGQVYNIAKTLNFMDKSANRGDSFRVLDTQKMMADFTAHKPAPQKEAANNTDWNSWFDAPLSKAASATNPNDINSWIDDSEKAAKIVEEDGKFTVYSEDGSKRLSKPGTKADAVKRLREVEYFKKHKKANTVPNLGAIAHNDNYTAASAEEVASLPKTAAEQIKEELRKESYARYELEASKQIMDDAAEEARKIASELLELHRINPLPFAAMEHDAYYCSEDTGGVKAATEFVVNFFKSKGWSLDRHDFSKGMPKLARDRHNILPLFNSLQDQLELHKSASVYVEELEKQATTATRQTIDFPVLLEREREKREKQQEEDKKKFEGKLKGIEKTVGEAATSGAELLSAGKKVLSPETYMNQQTKEVLQNILKTPTLPSVNVKQKKIDTAVEDVSRVSELQRLLLTDPIIGEADPETVVSLYNTLASANPEIVRDRNLLRFALREAIQYDAVPLHTYKDLISMGKDRASTMQTLEEMEDRRYKI